MDQDLNQGLHCSIPVFVFFDQEFNERDVWIERPKGFARQLDELRRELFAREPELQGLPRTTSPGELPEGPRERLLAVFGALREEQRANANAEVVRELRALLGLGERATAPSSFVPGARPARPAGHRVVKVSITYCAECGYEPQTIELASKLLYTFGHDLAAIELIPWVEGSFEVVVDGELVHSMYREGGFPEPDAIVADIRRRLAKAPRARDGRPGHAVAQFQISNFKFESSALAEKLRAPGIDRQEPVTRNAGTRMTRYAGAP